MEEQYLSHHGILGQRWGKRNGPPYPLDAEDHSAREKKEHWRRSLSNNRSSKQSEKSAKKNQRQAESSKRNPSDSRKRALKIGAAAVAAALATYGTYKLVKSGKLDEMIERGKAQVDAFLKENGQQKIQLGSIEDVSNTVSSSRKITESLGESLKKANPLGKDNNCTACSIAGILRTMGINATAKDCGEHSLEKLMDAGFKGVRGVEATAFGFGRSPQKAAEMLLKRYGENAKGVCGIQWTSGRGGHAFSWVIENGNVTFLDFQKALKGTDLHRFWNSIDRNGPLELYRIDDVLDKLDVAGLDKYIDVH